MFNYQGATALVTGASKGLGVSYAHALAERGTNLVLVARSIEKLQMLADRLTAQYGVRCIPIGADLAAPDAARKLVRELEERKIQIDLLVNNAGLGLTGDFLSHDIDEELAVVQVNVQTLLSLSHLLGAKMAARRKGGIINIASNSSFMPLPAMAVYAASKAFVLHFTEALRHEMAPGGVQVMAVCPGTTATSFFDGTTTTMKASAFDSAERVVTGTLRDFERRKSISYPGRASVRVGILLPRLFPRDITVRIAAMAASKMGLATA